MRYICALLLAFVVSYDLPVTLADQGDQRLEGSLGLSWQSELLKPGLSRVIYDEPVQITDLTLSYKGVYFRAWNSLGIGNDDHLLSNPGDELDLTVGWKGNIQGFDVKVFVDAMDFNPVNCVNTNDLLDNSVAISKTFTLDVFETEQILKPEMRADWLAPVDNITEGTPILMPNVTHTWKQPFGIKMLTFSEQFGLEWNDKFGKNNRGTFFQYNTCLVWKIGKHVNLSLPTISLVTPFENTRDGRKTEAVFGSTISFGF